MSVLLRVVAIVLLITLPVLAQQPLIVKVSCHDGQTVILEPARLESLILRARGRTVQWELQTAGCPSSLSRVTIRFARTSPFGETPEDKELIAPELPSPLPETVPLISRQITTPGEHPYEVLLLDAEGNTLSKQQGRISVRAIAPGMTLPGFLVAGLVVGLFFWVIGRRLSALSA
ncbi:MAG: hypothetical protein RMJ29_07115 [Candidatus Bipolaricaulota bacterium]|nr:hypothetical protein [Candidatus Bipolaricaulota bacterium]